MCYSNELDHKGIKILISDCLGVGFDWDDPKLREAVENRDESIWEILEWMTHGGAKQANEAFSFASDISYSASHALMSFDMQFKKKDAKLDALLDNPYLSQAAKDRIHAFRDGSLRREVQEQRAHEKANKVNPKEFGFVYLILAENGLYKIGKARSLKSRLKPFSVHFPMKWDLVYSFYSKNYNTAEASLHERFKDKRDIGEWFKLSDSDVEYIKSIQGDPS